MCLAPMAGLTHAAFRELVASYGGCTLFFTEMLNIRALVYQNPEKDPYLCCGTQDRPLVAQLVGREPDLVAQAIERLEALGRYAGYDLNFGCSRGAIQRYGWGVALMQEPELAADLVRAASSATSKPITVKLRSGPRHDPQALLSLAHKLVEAGAKALTLHPRAAKEGFKRRARWEEIKLLAQELPVPVFGNGDVFGPEDAQKMLNETGCAGVMIGRAALLRPWIFRDTKAHLETGSYPEPPLPWEPIERLIPLLKSYLPPELWEKRLELYLFWYLQNFSFGLHYFSQIKRAQGLEEKLFLLRKLLQGEKIRPYPARPYLLR